MPLQPSGRRGAVTPSKFSTYGNTVICGKTVENELTPAMMMKILVRNRMERAPLVMKNSAHPGKLLVYNKNISIPVQPYFSTIQFLILLL